MTRVRSKSTDVRDLMWRDVGLFREGDSLRRTVATLDAGCGGQVDAHDAAPAMRFDADELALVRI